MVSLFLTPTMNTYGVASSES